VRSGWGELRVDGKGVAQARSGDCTAFLPEGRGRCNDLGVVKQCGSIDAEVGAAGHGREPPSAVWGNHWFGATNSCPNLVAMIDQSEIANFLQAAFYSLVVLLVGWARLSPAARRTARAT
jgi:hypothetical protein